LRLGLQPYLSLLKLDYAVDDFVIALKQRATDGLRGEASNAFDSAPKAVRRKQRIRLPGRTRVFLAVHRHENRLYFKRLEGEAFALLTALSRGVTLADACIEAISSSGENEVDWPPKIQAWFQNWAALGWLCRARNEWVCQLDQPRYEKFATVANYLRAPLLLAVRVLLLATVPYRQRQAPEHRQDGRVFGSLNIPMPVFSAYLAGATECFGGLLLMIGLASRLVAIPVAFTMIVAYLTADYESFTSIFSDPDKFVGAAPFPFLLSALLVLAFGPGALSVDALIKRFAATRRRERLRF
jgi:putative oxidoreductase